MRRDNGVNITFDVGGIGTIIAILLSWSMNHSIFWCVIHGILGWIYIIYYLIVY